MPAAHGDSLSLCHGMPSSALQANDSSILASYLQPNGTVSFLKLTQQPATNGCSSRNVDLKREHILWAGFAPKITSDMSVVGLQGQVVSGVFKPGEVIPQELPGKGSAPKSVRMPKQKTSIFSTIPDRSAWFWSPSVWMETSQKIFEARGQYKLGRVFITVPIRNGLVVSPDELRAFLSQAHADGLQVWAVMGDPRAALEEEKNRFVSAAAALEDFNYNGTKAERLDGLQLDIEVYLLPGFWLDQAAWLSRYSSVINSISQAAPDVELDLVLPFWMSPESPDVLSMLEEVLPNITRLTVMDYRTDPDQIEYFATIFLDWGAEHGKQVTIAIETLPMPIEDRRYYQQAESGELVMLTMGGYNLLFLLDKPGASSEGIKAFRYSHQRQIDGTEISFFRRQGDLSGLLDKLEGRLKPWVSFSGMAIHGLDQR